MYNLGDLIAKNVHFQNNAAGNLCLPKQRALAAGILIAHSSPWGYPLGLAQLGGAIYVRSGNLKLIDNVFDGNAARDVCRGPGGACLGKH